MLLALVIFAGIVHAASWIAPASIIVPAAFLSGMAVFPAAIVALRGVWKTLREPSSNPRSLSPPALVHALPLSWRIALPIFWFLYVPLAFFSPFWLRLGTSIPHGSAFLRAPGVSQAVSIVPFALLLVLHVFNAHILPQLTRRT